MFKEVKEQLANFIEDESGMEILQAAIVVVISVFLAGIMFALGKTIFSGVERANDRTSQEFDAIFENDSFGGEINEGN